MFVLDSVACTDAFPQDGQAGGAQIIAQNGSTGGYASVIDADVYVQLAFGPDNILQWTPAVHVGPGNIILAAGTKGIRFRNYTAGTVATVSAGLSEPLEPPMQLTSAGVSASSSVASLVTGATVAALNTAAGGAPTNGQLGLLQLPSGTDMLLTFDSSISKWVSDPTIFEGFDSQANQTLVDIIAIAEIANTYKPRLEWAEPVAAGLTLQYRLSALLGSSGGVAKTITMTLGMYRDANGAAPVGPTWLTSTSLVDLGGGVAGVFWKMNWTTQAGAPATADYMALTLGGFRSAGGVGITANFQQAQIETRWTG